MNVTKVDQVMAECERLGLQTRTAATMRIVLAELAKGLTVERAAKLAGISESAVKGWRHWEPVAISRKPRLA